MARMLRNMKGMLPACAELAARAPSGFLRRAGRAHGARAAPDCALVLPPAVSATDPAAAGCCAAQRRTRRMLVKGFDVFSQPARPRAPPQAAQSETAGLLEAVAGFPFPAAEFRCWR